MKDKLIFLALLLFPISVFAELEFFLSNQNIPSDSEAWTSNIYPDEEAEYISIKFTPNLTPIPNEYLIVDTLVQEIFTSMSSQSTVIDSQVEEIEQYKTDLYETLIATEHPQFIEYIITSVNPETETIIEEKIEQNIILTPFEETFYNCNISLQERQDIVIDVLERIESGEIENLENITYSQPGFGDCIIPFPDIRHRESIIEESFQSNQLIAQKILNQDTQYEVHESIENIMNLDSEYQESFIESEEYFSELVETSVISSTQYGVNEDIQSYYKKILRESDLSYDQHKKIFQDQAVVTDNIMYFGKLLQQQNISSDEYSIYLEDLKKFIELQKYFFHLFELGTITFDQYSAYIQEGLTYIKNKKNITQSYINSNIKEIEYEKSITENQKIFEERYIKFSEYFSETEVHENQENTIYYWLIGALFLLTFFLVIILILIKVYKNILGEK